MSDIIKRESEFSDLEKLIIDAHAKPRIREFLIESLEDSIMPFIARAHQNRGQSGTAEDNAYMCEALARELKRSFKNLSLQDVEIALDLGSKGLLRDVKGAVNVTLEVMFKWIVAYDEQIRREAIHKQREWEEKQEKVRDEEEEKLKIKKFEEFIIKAYEEFAIGDGYDNVYQVANIYSYLQKRGKIDIEEVHLLVIEERVATEFYLKREEQVESFAEKAMRKQKGNELKKYQETEIKMRVQAEALLAVFTNWKQQNYKLEL